MALPETAKTFEDLNAASNVDDPHLLALQQGDPPVGGGSPTPTRKLSLSALFTWLTGKFGTAAQADTGTRLTDVPTGQDLADGLERNTTFSSPFNSARIFAQLNDDFNAREYLLLVRTTATDPAELVHGRIDFTRHIGSVLQRGGWCDIRVGRERNSTELGVVFQASASRSSNVDDVPRLETVDYDGQNWLALRLPPFFGASTSFNGWVFGETADTLRFVAAGDVSNATPYTPSGNVWSGRPGDSIGDNGALRNTNQSLSEATDFSQGSDTQSGDGSTTTFTIAHGLGNTPTSVNVQPESSEAAATHYVSGYDSTNITVEYSAAPANATDNLSWSFQAFREV